MIAYVSRVFKQRSVTQIYFKDAPGILAERFCFAGRTKYLTALQQNSRYAIFISLIFLQKRRQTSALDICHLLLLFFYIFIHTTASKADIRSRSAHLKRGNAYLRSLYARCKAYLTPSAAIRSP